MMQIHRRTMKTHSRKVNQSKKSVIIYSLVSKRMTFCFSAEHTRCLEGHWEPNNEKKASLHGMSMAELSLFCDFPKALLACASCERTETILKQVS